MAPEQLEAWVLASRLTPQLPQALGVPPEPAAKISDAGSVNPLLASLPTQTWQHVELMPGLALALKQDASQTVHRVAARLYAYLQQLIDSGLNVDTNLSSAEH